MQWFAQAEGEGSQDDDRPFGGWISELDGTSIDEPAELGDTTRPTFELPGPFDPAEMPNPEDYGQAYWCIE